jgi:hypothetical protein
MKKHKNKPPEFTRNEIEAFIEAGWKSYDSLSGDDQERICLMITSLESACMAYGLKNLLREIIEMNKNPEGIISGEIGIDPSTMLHFSGHYFIRIGMGLACQLEVKP